MGVYKKHHSKCAYSYTLAKAIYDVGRGLGCQVNVVKTRRCSNAPEIAADALSVGDWERAWEHMPLKEVDPRRLPVVLLRWIQNPYPDLSIGKAILEEMSTYTNVLFKK